MLYFTVGRSLQISSQAVSTCGLGFLVSFGALQIKMAIPFHVIESPSIIITLPQSS